jgi:ABC-type nitrate/sulfonate/bicarbonate transport system permease component
VALFGVWELSVRLYLPSYLPKPSSIAEQLGPTLGSSEFWDAMVPTLVASLIGLVIGCTAGVVLGLLTARLKWLRYMSAPYVSGLYAMPLIALVPILTLWLGYSGKTRLAVVILAGLLPCMVSTRDGAQHVPSVLMDACRVMHAPGHRIIRDLMLPSTLAYIMAGVQTSIGRILTGAVVVELLASINGSGFYILTMARSFQQDKAFVAVLFLAAIGLAFRQGSVKLLRLIAPWYHDSSG